MSMRTSHFTGPRQNRFPPRETHETHNTHEFPQFKQIGITYLPYHWQGDAVIYRSSDIIFYAPHIYRVKFYEFQDICKTFEKALDFDWNSLYYYVWI